MRLLLCLAPAVFAGALAACGGSSSGSGAGGDGSVASTSGPTGSTGSTASAGSGGASASSSDVASSAASTGSGGAGGGDPSVTATVNPTTLKAGDSVTVSVTVENFELVPPGGKNVPGEGHYHVYLDGATGGNYLAAGQTPTKVVTIPAATTPGMHTLRVNISNNDHSPLSPPVEDVLPIAVE